MLFITSFLLLIINPDNLPEIDLDSKKQYGDVECVEITTGELWSMVCNNGSFGSGYQWPRGRGPYYLWNGELWVGTMIKNETGEEIAYVSHADYADNEWEPEEWIWIGPGKSDFDAVCSYHDWGPQNWGVAIGIRVIQRTLSWSYGPSRHIIAYEYDIIFDRSRSDIAFVEDKLNLYCSWVFDADVSSADPTDPHIDDLVSYDGWTNGEWNTLTHYPSPSDEFTILQDTSLPIPDGIPDQVCIFGDEPNENTILGDTQLIWRDMSFMLDGDNPDEIGNDSTDYGLSAGFIFSSVLYAPKSPNDSIWIDVMGNTCRLIRPASHQWWNWYNDPGADLEKLNYMRGIHPMSLGYKFMPHPFDVGAKEFDYRFLLTYGPFKITQYVDTLHFVLATGVGQGLNGGVDEGYGRGYLPGARQLSDYSLMMYYEGSTQSDPYHPSAPDEDIHWFLPNPPEVPELHYSASRRIVNLIWSDIAEVTTDRRTDIIDFAGYRIYRSSWDLLNWELLDTFTIEEGNIKRYYDDKDVSPGIPYYYSVTAFDTEGLQSDKVNFMRDESKEPLPIYVPSPIGSSLDSVLVAPNPYYGSASWEVQNEDKIKFMKLPQNSRIKIFSLGGDLVWEREHVGIACDVDWDLKRFDGKEVSSGLYVYKIEQSNASGTEVVDTRIGKLLIMK